MSQIVEPSEDEPLGALAVNLIALAKARGIEGPEVVTDGEFSAFSVSDELYEAWQGAPDPQPGKGSEDNGEAESARSFDGDKPAKSRKSRKGDK